MQGIVVFNDSIIAIYRGKVLCFVTPLCTVICVCGALWDVLDACLGIWSACALFR